MIMFRGNKGAKFIYNTLYINKMYKIKMLLEDLEKI